MPVMLASLGQMERSLVVKLTCGLDAPERANQALTVGATAIAAGAQVSLWLTGDASWFAVPGRAETLDLPYPAPTAKAPSSKSEASSVPCVRALSRCRARPLNPEIRGAAAFVEESLAPGAQALVY